MEFANKNFQLSCDKITMLFLRNKLIINNITKFILSKNHLSFCHNKQIQPLRHLSPINKIINNILLIRYYKQAKSDWDIEIAYCDFLTNDKMTKSPC